jgi:Na+-translocating ferredoxin:NAD+ oxidoreductase subunit D
MTNMSRDIEIRSSPHLKRKMTVDKIMRTVVLALMPISGLCGLAVRSERAAAAPDHHRRGGPDRVVFLPSGGQGNTVGDWSAVITGLLLG